MQNRSVLRSGITKTSTRRGNLFVLWKVQQEVQKWICTRFAFIKYFHIELFCHSWVFPDVTSSTSEKPGCPAIGRGRSSRLGSNLGNASCPRQRGRGKQKKVCTFLSGVLVLKTTKSGESKERRQNYFLDLPPTPLAENHFGKKTLAEENRQNFPKWNWWKGTKISIFFCQK